MCACACVCVCVRGGSDERERERYTEDACFFSFLFQKRDCAYFFFLHKVHKSCPLDLHGLTLPVIQRQDEMEKIGLSEVGWGLLFIMCPCQADTAAGRKQESISVKHRTPGGGEGERERERDRGLLPGDGGADGSVRDAQARPSTVCVCVRVLGGVGFL